MDKNLLAPFDYTFNIKGKNFRTHLIKLFATIYKVPEDLIKQISYDVACIHTTSINIDDIQDESDVRRGKPCSYLIYGVPNTINSSFYALFTMLQNMKSNYPICVSQIILDEIVNLHQGQGLDIIWNEQKIIPDLEEYYKMIDLKTTSLFRLVHNLCFTLGQDNQKKII